MSLHDDLLAQARHLAGLDNKKPRQANLRRAVSSAYYALFHLIVGAGGYEMAPANPPGLKLHVQRAFEHGAMKAVCRKFIAKDYQLPLGMGNLIAQPVEPQLIAVAKTFVELQEARHQADYDLTTSFARDDVSKLIDSVEVAFREWQATDGAPNRSVFVAAMMFQKR